MDSPKYPDNLTDNEWTLVKHFIDVKSKLGGKPSLYGKRAMLDAVLYILRTGCSWRHLPKDFPSWMAVYSQYRTWVKKGTFLLIHEALAKKIRKISNKESSVRAAIVDSQSVKVSDRGGLHGYDGGKKINGRKRHILTDMNGNILELRLTEANFGDRKGLKSLLSSMRKKFPNLKKIYADMGYQGFEFTKEIKDKFQVFLEIIKKPRKYFYVPHGVTDVNSYLESIGYKVETGFQVQAKRWIVERTFAWLGKFRRLSKDYEYKILTSESFIYLAMIRHLLRRLSKSGV